MSNQIVISSGAKVRNLSGVLTGTSGVVNSLGINVPDGIPQLDSNGKILVAQLPNSVMEYKGTWNVSTNTPTLANGTGNQGDVYLVEGAASGGTAFDFGAGPITFYNGDQVVYSGSIWQRASGSTGTVTSVAVTESGDALTITGSPITNSGTINIGFAGTGSQYIKGDGTLATFPTTIDQAKRLITEVYNSTGATLTKGTIVYINGGQGNLPTITKAQANADNTSAQTYGVVQSDITNNNNGFVVVLGSLTDLDTQAYSVGTQLYLSGTTAGEWTSTKPSAPIHLVYVGIVVRSHPTQGVVEVRIQNGYELDELHDVSITSVADNNILQYNSATSLWENVAGTTTNIAEGTNQYFTNARARSAISLTTSGTSGLATYNSTTGVLNIPNYSESTFGTVTSVAMTVPTGLSVSGSPITTSGTLAVSLASGYSIPTTAKQTEWDTAYTNRITSASFPLSISSNAISISLASASTAGYLSIADWNTFNGKQNALTNPVTGTGNSGYVSIFTGTSTIGNSIIFQSTTRIGIMTATPSTTLDVNGGGNFSGSIGALSFVKSGGTSSQFLKADGSVDSNTYISSLSASSPLSYNSGTGVISISAATGSTNGYLSSTDWLAFYAKQDAITLTTTGTSGPATLVGSTLNIPQYAAGVSGSGTTNTLPKFTGTSAIGDSNITDNGTLITLGSNSYINGSLGIGTTSLTSYSLRVSKNITGGTTARGLSSDGTIQSDVTANAVGLGSQLATAAAAFTLTNLYQFYSGQGTIGAGSTVTNQYGYHADATLIGATNNYGFRGAIPSGTNRWNLYMDGTANNYLNGSLGIGTTSLTGYSLRVLKNLTGAGSSYGISSEGVIQSDATLNGFYFNTVASTAAATFTTGNIVHYFAQQGTFGAGSTVTRQYGFFVAGSLTGATNNYGFYGDIASGANRWNLYMNGTAQNYLAGNLGLGVAVPVAPLQLGNGYTDANYDGYRNTGSPSFLMAYGQTSVIHRILGGVYNQAGTVNLDLSLAIAKDRGTSGSGFRITSGVGAGANASNGYLAFSSLTGANDETFTATEAMRLVANGNLLIGTTTDSGEKLQVTGTAKITGNLTASGTGNSLGTITTGIWNGTAIADAYIASAATWNAKQNAINGTGFVKASGTTITYDNSTYLTTSSAASTYLPLSGGTLTGNLTINPSTTEYTLIVSTPSTNNTIKLLGSTASNTSTIGYWSSDGGTGYGALNFTPTNTRFEIVNGGSFSIYTSGNERLTVSSSGAATFSSSVTAGGQLAINSAFGTSTSAISIYNSTGASASNIAQLDFRLNNSFGGNERVASITALNPNAAANNGGALVFSVSANGTGTTPSEDMRITSSGNVGIGTSSPDSFGTQRLLVLGNGAASQVARFTDGANADLVLDNPSAGVTRITAQYGGAGTLAFASGTGFNETMRITSGGNVLVGTTTDAGQKLQVEGITKTNALSLGATTFSSSTTLTSDYFFWEFTGGAGVTLTLYSSSGHNNTHFIKNSSGVSLTISGTIYTLSSGAPTSSITLGAYKTIQIISRAGSAWYIMYQTT